MISFITSRLLRPAACMMAAAAAMGLSGSAQAQVTRGFDKTVTAQVQLVELTRQNDIWMMEVQFKPMRMVFVDLPDPKTGELKQEQVWYLAWRSIVRPVDHREGESIAPVNALDSLPGPPQFIPEFTLITYDDPSSEVPAQILQDEILPAAMVQLRRTERAPHRNSVQVIQDVPAPTPSDAEEQPWIYGAATWRGVDPETDFFKVILAGFTNAYETRAGDDGSPHIWRKVIVQKYARPGDRFDPNHREFLFVGEPAWVMQPDPQASQATK
ncbi:hypothetical protein SH661x_003125 [Planctomicrobium sp. SH661]|uniref:hypothetical protein n=1 Tax=Planctomicrobium sp. SH661 TaxID=3448124 RepID=UPI003F5C938C